MKARILDWKPNGKVLPFVEAVLTAITPAQVLHANSSETGSCLEIAVQHKADAGD